MSRAICTPALFVSGDDDDMNVNRNIKKLQTAIIRKGLIITINRTQFYSAEYKKVINLFKICTPITFLDKKRGKWLEKDFEILKTCSVPEIMQCLVDIYKAVSG